MVAVRRLVLVAMVSSVFVLQAGAAGAASAKKKAPNRVQRAGAMVKRAASATRKFVRDRVGVAPGVRQVNFAARLKLQQGDVAGATVIMKNPGIPASGGSLNFRERASLKRTQGKINRAWKKEVLRQLGPGVPESFNRPPPPPSEPAHTGQYL